MRLKIEIYYATGVHFNSRSFDTRCADMTKKSIEPRNAKSGLPSRTVTLGYVIFPHVTTWKKEFRMLLAFTELLGNFQMRNLNGMNFSHLIHSLDHLEFRGIKEIN